MPRIGLPSAMAQRASGSSMPSRARSVGQAGHRLLAIVARVDIAATRDQDAIDAIVEGAQHFEIVDNWNNEGNPTGGDNRVGVIFTQKLRRRAPVAVAKCAA